ncbi:MAG: phospholipase [Betaproteobacteria bacterium HGW-Betaproteobacteria-22]|nr:MAG: phospholipase [Betaproteobacteria bacterium HGW-Betaproteobacteria-22]
MHNKQTLSIHLILVCGLMSMPLVPEAKEMLTVEQAIYKCKITYPSQFESKKRLACYDSITTPAIESVTQSTAENTNVTDMAIQEETPKEALLAAEDLPKIDTVVAIAKPSTELGYLERKWRLTSQGDWDASDFETYRSNYLIVTKSSHPNDTPVSPSQNNTDDRNLDAKDLKFQLSLKTEMMGNIPIIRDLPYVTSSRIWAAYTQQSYWQIFNGSVSRPFRETNYEPEVILSLGIDNQVDGVKKSYIPRMLNLGLVHQSNGRANPLSRSWNRLYLEGGFVLTDRISLMVRPWWRFSESQDDNPDIDKYLGYGDVTFRWEDYKRKHAATIMLRNNLRSDNKGYAKIDLQRQVFNNPYLKLHITLSSGYGESLLDYNHSQSIFGVGISLGE